MWSKSSQGRGKVTQPLPLAQPASTLKLRQAVIINEETWANGQEMQRYWLGRLPCSKPYRLAPAWWPVVSQAAVYRGGEGWRGGRPRCETRPPLAAVCHIQATPEGRSPGDTRHARKMESEGLVWVVLVPHRSSLRDKVSCVVQYLSKRETSTKKSLLSKW